MLHIYGRVFCSFPRLSLYLRLRISSNPRSTAVVPFDSAGRFRTSLSRLLHTTYMHSCCNWIASCVAAWQTKNQKPSHITQIYISWPKLSIIIHWYHLGPIPSSWRIPAQRVDLLRAAASSSGENTSWSVKPAALNSIELIIIATGICEESTFSVGSHSSNVRHNASSSTRFTHRLITRALWPS